MGPQNNRTGTKIYFRKYNVEVLLCLWSRVLIIMCCVTFEILFYFAMSGPKLYIQSTTYKASSVRLSQKKWHFCFFEGGQQNILMGRKKIWTSKNVCLSPLKKQKQRSDRLTELTYRHWLYTLATTIVWRCFTIVFHCSEMASLSDWTSGPVQKP